MESEGWINIKDKLPEINTKVLIVNDPRKWDKNRKPRILIANVGIFEKETIIGGPNALTGYHKMIGIYFAVPAILHPDSINFWQPLPSIEKIL